MSKEQKIGNDKAEIQRKVSFVSYFVNVLLAVGCFPPFGYFGTHMPLLETSLQKELSFTKIAFHLCLVNIEK